MSGVVAPAVIATEIDHQQKNSAGAMLPIVLQPNEGQGPDGASAAALAAYVSTSRDQILGLAAENGAVLLRGF